MKKILIIYSSVGLGHKVVAENIAEALRSGSDNEKREIVLLDLLELYRGAFTNVSTTVYTFIIKYLPWLWHFFYDNKVFHALTLPLRVPFAGFKSKKLRDFVQNTRPDLILSSHPASSALVSYLKLKEIFTGPFAVTFSDFHFQPYWVLPRVDRYLVMTKEQKDAVVKLGFSPKRVIITGLPVNNAFAQQFDVPQIFREFEVRARKPIVLVMGGSRGWGIKIADIQKLLSSALDFQIVVLVGHNLDMYNNLKSLSNRHRENLKVFADLSHIEVAKLFSIAKILVTKPGGLTIGQALLKNLPLVLVNPLPAMEVKNQTYLLNFGAAVAARNSDELLSWVERLLRDKKLYNQMQHSLKSLAYPEAASLAATAVIDIL